MEIRLKLLLVFFATLAAAENRNPVRQFLAENRLEDALPLCRQYEVLSTNDADNFLACAWVYFRSERAEAAEKLLERAKKGANQVELQTLLAYGFVARGMLPAAELKVLDEAGKRKYDDTLRLRLDEAQRRLEPIISQNRGTVPGKQAQELSAELYEMKGQLDTAAFIYRGLVGEEPASGRVQWGLGRYYAARGDLKRAILHLEETTRLWPKHVESRYRLGVIYLSLTPENFRDSARWFAEAYKLNRADPATLEQIGLLFEKKDRLSDALRYWQRALQLNADAKIAKEKTTQYFVQVVDGLVESRKFADALAKLEGAGKAVNEDPKFQLRKGIILRNLAKYDKAAPILTTYLDSSPDDPTALRELGISLLNLKKTDQASVLFARALELDPKNGLNHAWMAYTWESKKEFGKALQAWKKASELLKEPEDQERAAVKIAKLEKRNGKKKLKPAVTEEREVASEPEQDDSVEVETLE